MEEFLRNLVGDRITLIWLFIIVGVCWFAYIPGRDRPTNRDNRPSSNR